MEIRRSMGNHMPRQAGCIMGAVAGVWGLGSEVEGWCIIGCGVPGLELEVWSWKRK